MESASTPGQNRPKSMAARQSEKRFAVSDGKGTVLGVCVLLAVAVFLVFGQTLRHKFINYDDDAYVWNNPKVVKGLTFQGITWAFTHSHCNNWHPLTWMSHMLDCQLYGLNAGGHHFANVLLHAATAILLFLVLRQMTGALWPGAFVAAVFAIHPLRVESVVWVSERKDVLSGLFFMLTLLMYARHARRKSVLDSRFWPLDYGLALLFFALGLMSKPMLVTLPFVLLLLDYWPLQRFTIRSSRNVILRLVVEKLPFLLLSAASCAVTVLVQGEAVKSMVALPLASRLGNALVSYVTYLVQMVWPENLAVFYPYRPDVPVWQVACSGALLLSVTTVALLAVRRLPCFLVGWLWYLGMLVSVIGLVQVGDQSHADRYTYLPQIGLYLIIAWIVRDLTVSWRHRRQILGAAAFTVIAALMVCARKQTSYWRNSESLWNHTIACTAGNYVAYTNLGATIANRGRFPEAIEYFQKALEINPDSAETHNDWGKVLLEQGRTAEAIEHFQKAVEIDPDCAEAHNNLGILLAAQGQTAQAIKHYQIAIKLNPDRAEVYNNLGNVLATQGRTAEAIEHFQKALEIEPYYAKAHHNLANVLAAQGRLDEAIAHFQNAVELRPDYSEAQNDWGTILLEQGRFAEAMEHFQKAVQLNPDFAGAHDNLAATLALQGRPAEAIEHYQRSLQIKPDNAKARYNLANILAAQGRLDEATEHYQRALELMPNFTHALYQLGLVLQSQGKFAAAIAQFQKILELDPRHVSAQNNLAWLLATCPEASLRNGNRATALARQAEQLSGGGSPQILDTLAAAYAEAGHYPEAIETADRALQLAGAQHNAVLAAAIRMRLKLYATHSPYREKP